MAHSLIRTVNGKLQFGIKIHPQISAYIFRYEKKMLKKVKTTNVQFYSRVMLQTQTGSISSFPNWLNLTFLCCSYTFVF